MALEVFVVEVSDVILLRCTGRIAAGDESDVLQKEIEPLRETHHKFIIHLGDVTFIDSSGMGMLVRLSNSVRAKGGDLKLCNVGETLLKALKLTRLDKSLEIYEHELDAINAFFHQREAESSGQAGAAVIVCVDSSENVQAYLRELLSRHGYSAKTAPSAYDARPMLKTMRPALVILGPHVPGAQNANFQEALKGIPVLTLPPDFHTSEAGETAEKLLADIKAKITQSAGKAKA